MDQHVTGEILCSIPVAFVVFLYRMMIPLTAAFYPRRDALACRLPARGIDCTLAPKLKENS